MASALVSSCRRAPPPQEFIPLKVVLRETGQLCERDTSNLVDPGWVTKAYGLGVRVSSWNQEATGGVMGHIARRQQRRGCSQV